MMSLLKDAPIIGVVHLLFDDGEQATLRVVEVANANGFPIKVVIDDPPRRTGLATDWFDMALNDGGLREGVHEPYDDDVDEARFAWRLADGNPDG